MKIALNILSTIVLFVVVIKLWTRDLKVEALWVLVFAGRGIIKDFADL